MRTRKCNTRSVVSLGQRTTIADHDFSEQSEALLFFSQTTTKGNPMKGIIFFGLLTTLLTFTSTAKASTCTDIQVHGGDGNGIVDNSSALTSALAALGADGGCISFPAGTYYFSTLVSYSLGSSQAVQLVGSGPQGTTLNGQGLAFTLTTTNNSLQVRNMTISTGVPAANSAVAMSGGLGAASSPSLIEDVVISATGTGSWPVGLQIQGNWNVRVNRTQFFATSVGAELTPDSNHAGAVSGQTGFTNCQFESNVSGNTGLLIGFGAELINVDHCYFSGPSTGILFNPNASAGYTGSASIDITSNTFNNFSTAVNANSTQWLNIIGNSFIGGTMATHGGAIPLVSLGNVNDFVIQSNQFIGIGTGSGGPLGLKVGNSLYGGIGFNFFANMSTGIKLALGAQYVNVQSNAYQNITNDVVNNGSNNQLGGGSKVWRMPE